MCPSGVETTERCVLPPPTSLARVLTQLLLFHCCVPTAKEEQHVPEHVVDEPFADERPQTEGSRRTRPPVLTTTRTAESISVERLIVPSLSFAPLLSMIP